MYDKVHTCSHWTKITGKPLRKIKSYPQLTLYKRKKHQPGKSSNYKDEAMQILGENR